MNASISRTPSASPANSPRNSSMSPSKGTLRQVAGSWRLLSVVLMSFSSGLPLGVVWFAIPAWMAREGVDIKVIGLFTASDGTAGVPFLSKLPLIGWLFRNKTHNEKNAELLIFITPRILE